MRSPFSAKSCATNSSSGPDAMPRASRTSSRSPIRADRWLEARCREGDASRAYAAWVDLLRRWSGEEGSADAAGKLLRARLGPGAQG